MKKLAATLAMVLLSGAIAAAQVQKKDVDIKAPDGVILKGTYFNPGKFGPALLLLHQCNMDRHAWDGVAADAAAHGDIHVLTIDFRGYGQSGGEKPAAANAQSVQQTKWPGDVDAAWKYLISQDGIDTMFLAAGGASCGVTQAADLAVRNHDIRALLLLSGSASDAAKAYLATANVVVFGAASEDDKAAAQGIRDVVMPARKSGQTVLKIYPGTEHGVAMFSVHPELPPFIVNWLKSQLCCRN